jgi:RNase P subunit RPR2
MVTVVNPKPHSSVIKRCICRNCGAELEYVPAEVQSKTVGDYGGGSDTYRFVTCPQCSQAVYLN